MSNQDYLNSINLMVLSDTMILPKQTIQIVTYPEEKIQDSEYIIIDELLNNEMINNGKEKMSSQNEDFSIFPCISSK